MAKNQSRRSGGRRPTASGRKRSRPRTMARKRRHMPVPVWAVAGVLVVLAGALAVWVWGSSTQSSSPSGPFEPYNVVQEKPWRARPGDLVAFADSVTVQAAEVLTGLGVPVQVVQIRRLPENRGSAMRWEVRSAVPGELPLAVCNLELSRLVQRLGGEVLEAKESLTGDQLSMLLGLSGKGTTLVTLRKNPKLARAAGRIAIIVDDFGYQDPALIEGFCALKQKLTLSIFPGFEQTPWIAERAVAGGHGVMVHMPMEPIDYPYRDPGEGAIFVEYPEEKIRGLVRKALAAVPHARGLNNHMGSRVTEDRVAIGAVLKEVYQYGFFFVDSVTSPKSVAYALAQEMKMSSGKNTMFLDLEDSKVAVEAALERLGRRARTEGTVIGIGHAKPATLAAFQEMLPELQERGIRFITAEEAVR
ncbi:MAG: divergent polysaccharide deacetylase family protein [bacterium]|nr:divergent polysaccharide deacetylase family protein [bacterium]